MPSSLTTLQASLSPQDRHACLKRQRILQCSLPLQLRRGMPQPDQAPSLFCRFLRGATLTRHAVRSGGTGAAGGAKHQQEPECPRRRHIGESLTPSSRAVPQLHLDVSSSGISLGACQRENENARLSARLPVLRQSRSFHVLFIKDLTFEEGDSRDARAATWLRVGVESPSPLKTSILKQQCG